MNISRTWLDIMLTFSRQFLAGLLQLFIILMIARSLGREGTGMFAICLLIPMVLGQILSFGLPTSSVYFIASRRFNRVDVWAVTRDITGCIALVGTIFAGLGLYYFGMLAFPGVNPFLLIAAVTILPFLLMTANTVAIFQATEDFRSYNIAVLIQPVLAFLIILAFSSFGLLSIEGAIFAVAFSHVGGLLTGLFLLSRRMTLFASTCMHAPYLKYALPYGLKAYLANIVSFINYRVDLFLVNLFLGPASAGVYTVAVRLVEQLWIVSQSVSTVILPRLSTMIDDDVGKSLLTPAITRYVLWVTASAAGALALIAAPLIAVLFGDSFTLAAGSLYILLPGVVLFSAARVLSNDLAASGLVGVNLILAITVLTTNTLLNISLIPTFGLTGAAASTALSYSLALVILLYLQMGRMNVPLLRFILPSKGDIAWIRSHFCKC